MRVHGGYRFNATAPRAYPREAYVKYNNRKSGAEIMPYTTNYLLARGFFFFLVAVRFPSTCARARPRANPTHRSAAARSSARSRAQRACHESRSFSILIIFTDGWAGANRSAGSTIAHCTSRIAHADKHTHMHHIRVCARQLCGI